MITSEFMRTSLTSRLDQYQETRRYRASHHRHNCHVAQVRGGYAETRLSTNPGQEAWLYKLGTAVC